MKDADDPRRRAVPRASVIISTRDRPQCLERCLQQLEKLEYRDFVAVVVDSAPSTRAAEAIAARYGAEYRVCPLKGLSRARNLGSYNARSEILAYLDDDMLPQQNWLGALVESFADKSVMAVTGPVLPLQLFGLSEAELQESLDLVPWGRLSFSIERSSAQWFERANFGGIGDGNFALRRSAFSQIRSFDEQLGRGTAINSNEEHYAFFRIIDLGGKVIYAPQAIVFHPNSVSSDKLARKNLRENAAYFCFLMFRHPFRILLVLKFAFEGFFGKKRWWCTFPKSRENQVPKWQKLSSGYKGFVDFLQSLVQMS